MLDKLLLIFWNADARIRNFKNNLFFVGVN